LGGHHMSPDIFAEQSPHTGNDRNRKTPPWLRFGRLRSRPLAQRAP
jgi:hypothetical protein